jgi:LytS/YehU family sensor histidine kinase
LVTIQELCLIDAQVASDTVAEFSQYLRHNIDSLSDKNPVPFEKELQHVVLYLSIEKKRFGEKLKIINDISYVDFHIPALTLQPIVENAVRHGLTARWEGGTLTMRTEELNGTIIITVSDNGVGFDINTIGGNSTGIKNVQSRLAALCNGSLEIDSKVGEGTTATIKIPIRTDK